MSGALGESGYGDPNVETAKASALQDFRGSVYGSCYLYGSHVTPRVYFLIPRARSDLWFSPALPRPELYVDVLSIFIRDPYIYEISLCRDKALLFKSKEILDALKE